MNQPGQREATESRTRERLRQMVDPATTAVLTMELQKGIVTGEALFPALVAEVERVGLLDSVRRICAAARAVGVRVVHCTRVGRADGAGQSLNCKVFVMGEKLRRQRGYDGLQEGGRGAELVDGLGDPADIVVSRLHGMTPFTSTSLDQILRNLGVRTVVATGVSVNIGVFGMVLSAVDLGYQVVLPRDGVAGVPPDYAQTVIDQTLSLLSTVVTADDLVAAWGSPEVT